MHTLCTFVLCYIVQEALLRLMSIRLWQWSSSSPTVYSQEWALCLLSFALSSIWCSEGKCELQCQQCIIVHTIAQIKAQGTGPIERATAWWPTHDHICSDCRWIVARSVARMAETCVEYRPWVPFLGRVLSQIATFLKLCSYTNWYKLHTSLHNSHWQLCIIALIYIQTLQHSFCDPIVFEHNMYVCIVQSRHSFASSVHSIVIRNEFSLLHSCSTCSAVYCSKCNSCSCVYSMLSSLQDCTSVQPKPECGLHCGYHSCLPDGSNIWTWLQPGAHWGG